MREIKKNKSPRIVTSRRAGFSRYNAVCKTGLAVSNKIKYGDLCLQWKGISKSSVFINSTVLINALLNSKDFLKKEFGIEVRDINDVSDPGEKYIEPEIVEPEPATMEPQEEPMKVEEVQEDEKIVDEDGELERLKKEKLSGEKIEDLPYQEIRAHAKAMGFDFKGNPKKEELLKMIKGE